MKNILLLAGLALSLGSSFNSEAQVRINVQIGAPVVQQSWYGYDDDYYYMPDQGVYYNVRRQVYVYPYGGNWVYGPSLPPSYGGYTYNTGRYYRINARAPFMRNDYYRSQYPVGYGGGYRNDRYYGGRHDNGNHNGWYKNGRGGRDWNDDRGRGRDGNDNRGGNRGGYDRNPNYGNGNGNGWNNGGNGRPDRR